MRPGIAVLLLLCSGVSWAQSSVCTPSSTTACVMQGRFEISLTFDTAGATFVPASAGTPAGSAEVATTTSDTAIFRFYDEDQFDVVVKVLDACPINQRFWVFAAGATDAGVDITVTDTAVGASVFYASGSGQAFPSVIDTNAFATCDATMPPRTADPGGVGNGERGPVACGATFCLQGGRYALDVDFSLTPGGGSNGAANSFSTLDHSGLGWLFSAENIEFVTSVLDGRADNGAFWFLAARMTSAELTYTLTDTQTDLVNIYVAPEFQFTNVQDRGQPVDASLRGVQGGDRVAFELLLTNTAPTERTFRATLPTPAGAANPRFTCSAAGGASCPGISGSGPFEESGPLAAGGALTYTILFDRAAARGTAGVIEAMATVETAAHALADTQLQVLVAGELPPALQVPLDAPWMLVCMALLLMLVARFAGRIQG